MVSQTQATRNYLPLAAIFPRLAGAAEDLALATVALAHEAAERDSAAPAARRRARQVAHLAAQLAAVVDGDFAAQGAAA